MGGTEIGVIAGLGTAVLATLGLQTWRFLSTSRMETSTDSVQISFDSLIKDADGKIEITKLSITVRETDSAKSHENRNNVTVGNKDVAMQLLSKKQLNAELGNMTNQKHEEEKDDSDIESQGTFNRPEERKSGLPDNGPASTHLVSDNSKPIARFVGYLTSLTTNLDGPQPSNTSSPEHPSEIPVDAMGATQGDEALV